MEPTAVVFQAFRAATATAMGRTTSLASTATGGLLNGGRQPVPGSAPYTTPVAMCTEASALRGTVFRCVA